MSNKAKMINPSLFIQAGIDRKTGLPLSIVNSKLGGQCKESIKRFLRLIDEQDAVNRYKWTVPAELRLTGQEIERFLYYKGQLCFFKLNGKYYLMPYALEGGLDFFGRYNRVHPVPYASGMEYDGAGANEKKAADDAVYKTQYETLASLKLKVIYVESDTVDIPEECCVLLHDYTKQIPQVVIPRYLVNDGLLDVMADMIPFMRTCAIASTGVRGIRVADADQSEEVNTASRELESQARKGLIYYPIVGAIEMQELTDKSGTKMQEYFQSLQSLDNLRLHGYGLENGGLFDKKAHKLEEEQQMDEGQTGLVMEDGLTIRKHFCDMVKKVFNIEISVEQNPNVNEAMDIESENKQTNIQYGGRKNDSEVQ